MIKPLRRVLSSANLLASLVLLGVLFIMVNYLASRHYAKLDLTRQHLSALSDRTVQTLRSLTEPVTVIVFYQPGHRLYELVRDLLGEYARVSPRIRLEYVDPEQDVARARQLVKEFEIDVTGPESLNLVIFQSGPRHKYLSDTDLAEYDYRTMTMEAQPRVKAFKGEEAFTAAILSVTQTARPLVWATSGHGEKSCDAVEPAGLSEFKRALEQQNVTVEPVTLLERKEIPTDVKLVIAAGPTRRFTETELAALEAYLRQGGRLLALIDPLEETGLDGLLERWGIALGMDIVVDPSRQLPFVSAANLFVTTYTEHPVVRKMKTLMTLFPLARSVRPAQPIPEGLIAAPLALTSADGWGETKTAVETFQFTKGEDLAGPVSIAVAAEHGQAQPAPAPDQPQATIPPVRTRVIVVGDSDFIINAQLGNVGNRDFVLGAVHWLLEQEQLIGIGPKTLESIKLALTGSQLRGIFWFSFLGMPMAFGLLGAGMWFLRRR